MEDIEYDIECVENAVRYHMLKALKNTRMGTRLRSRKKSPEQVDFTVHIKYPEYYTRSRTL